jgi:hypothetical protein
MAYGGLLSKKCRIVADIVANYAPNVSHAQCQQRFLAGKRSTMVAVVFILPITRVVGAAGRSRHGTNGTRWELFIDALSSPDRGSQAGAQDGRHADFGQGTNGTIRTGVAVLRLQNGSRWQ